MEMQNYAEDLLGLEVLGIGNAQTSIGNVQNC